MIRSNEAPDCNNANLTFKFLGVGVVFVSLYLMFRSIGLYPICFGDESIYSLLSRHTSLAQPYIPSYIYFALYKASSFCGDGFLDCARIINIFFLISALPFIYLVARQIATKFIASLIVLLSVSGPYNVYTASFLPECMYFSVFWFFTWIVLRFRGSNPIWYGLTAGFILALLSMIKVHAIFILPSIVVFIFFIYMRCGPPKWLKTAGIIAGCFVVSAAVTRLVVGYLFAGEYGLNPIGTFYKTLASNEFTLDLYDVASLTLTSLKGHFMGLAILFGVPLASFAMMLRNDNRESVVGVNRFAIQLYTLVIFASLLFVTASNTAAWARGGPFEHLFRLHMRYYSFACPLLLIIAASYLGTTRERIGLCMRLFSVLLVGFLIVYSIATRLSPFVPGLMDSPELFGFTTAPFAFYFLSVLGLVSLLIWAFDCNNGARLFLLIFMPLTVLISTYHVGKLVALYSIPTIYDRAGMFAHQFLSSIDGNESSKLVIMDRERTNMFRTSFYLDNSVFNPVHSTPNMIEIAENSPVDLSIIPPGTRWILLTADNKIPPSISFQIRMGGFTLIRVPGKESIDFKKSAWPGVITRMRGLSTPGSWGTWSNAKEVLLEFASPLPKDFDIHLKAFAFGPNAGQEFLVRIGDLVQAFRLSGAEQDVTLSFKTDGTEKCVIIEVPNPTSPKSLGLGDDGRLLGIALAEMSIEPTGNVSER
jgi:phosphoglycerol transferase